MCSHERDEKEAPSLANPGEPDAGRPTAVDPQSDLVLPKRLSPGDLTDYSLCPRKVWFRRGQHIRLEEEPNATLMLGNAVHAALYLFFGLPPEQREPTGQRLHACLRHAWREHCKPSFSQASSRSGPTACARSNS